MMHERFLGKRRPNPARAPGALLATVMLCVSLIPTAAPAAAVPAAVPIPNRDARIIREAAGAAMMPVVQKVVIDGDWAIAVGVFTWDRNSNRRGADPQTALLFHKLPFGWQALTATDTYSRCEFDGWRRAYGIASQTSVRLANASGLAYKKQTAECAITSADHARESGPLQDVVAIRKLLRNGLMVPFVAVSGAYGMAVANGDDVASILFQRSNGSWQRVADFEEHVDVRKLTAEFGVPKHAACAIVPGGSADSQCR